MAVKSKTSPHSVVPLPVQYITKRTEMKTVLCCIFGKGFTCRNYMGINKICYNYFKTYYQL